MTQINLAETSAALLQTILVNSKDELGQVNISANRFEACIDFSRTDPALLCLAGCQSELDMYRRLESLKSSDVTIDNTQECKLNIYDKPESWKTGTGDYRIKHTIWKVMPGKSTPTMHAAGRDNFTFYPDGPPIDFREHPNADIIHTVIPNLHSLLYDHLGLEVITLKNE